MCELQSFITLRKRSDWSYSLVDKNIRTRYRVELHIIKLKYLLQYFNQTHLQFDVNSNLHLQQWHVNE